MPRAIARTAIVVAVTIFAATQGQAQKAPTPGPTNPAPPPNPLAKPGTDLVINPTANECRKGWRPGLKWTKKQFETFCREMRTSK